MKELKSHLQRGERVVLVGKPQPIVDPLTVLLLLLAMVTLFFFFIALVASLTSSYDGVPLGIVVILVGVLIALANWLHNGNSEDSRADLLVVTDLRIFSITGGAVTELAPRNDLEKMQIEKNNAILKIRDRPQVRIIIGNESDESL